uniref:COX assembly mitochondrial protein homolog n=1 Tax=Monopterus albus TaxID=43700 RepID=UPI0009B36AA1|nr:COX assembly mitochondrial protein homolog [Monopterus albus]
MGSADSEEIHLRHVEKDVLIPKLMREKARVRCAEKVEELPKMKTTDVHRICSSMSKTPGSKLDKGFKLYASSYIHDYKGRATLFLSSTSYKDPTFFEECKQEYIKEKLEFERTGIPAKNRKQKLPNSM